MDDDRIAANSRGEAPAEKEPETSFQSGISTNNQGEKME
jgi:hypothetical protein